MFEDVLAFAALPLAAAIVFTGIHTWFGLHVLRRNVVFADLALAQISALGATVAVVAGHAIQSAADLTRSLERAGLKPEVAEVTLKPLAETTLSGEDAVRMQKLLDALEDLDDVQQVYTTADLNA